MHNGNYLKLLFRAFLHLVGIFNAVIAKYRASEKKRAKRKLMPFEQQLCSSVFVHVAKKQRRRAQQKACAYDLLL